MYWFKDFTLIDCNKANSDNHDDTEDKMERDEGYCNQLGPWIIIPPGEDNQSSKC